MFAIRVSHESAGSKVSIKEKDLRFEYFPRFAGIQGKIGFEIIRFKPLEDPGEYFSVHWRGVTRP